MGRLDGKVALITGASQGQGEAHARLFAEEGAYVVLGDIQDSEGRAIAAEIGTRARYVHLDVTSEEDWANALEATMDFGRLDVLLNNAGIVRVSAIEQTSLQQYLDVIMVNEVGTFLGMRTVVPTMSACGTGSIINISSTAGFQGVPGAISYSASKFAVRGMTKAAALELGHRGIRVNSIHPGAVDTPQLAQDDFAGFDRRTYLRTLPIPRMCSPREVAYLALFLASDESLYCTGAEFVIEGGMLAGAPLVGIAPE
jgi:3alpha(or 20beta)-hydroxysteroid dehydrogenase